jgi:hypothetical protein
MESKIERIKKYRDIRIQNIKFIKERLKVQGTEAYKIEWAISMITPSMFCEADLQVEQSKLDLAEDWLKKNGVACDNIGHKIPVGFIGLHDHFPEWRKREFSPKDNEKVEVDNQTEGYPAQKGWPGFYHQTNDPN